MEATHARVARVRLSEASAFLRPEGPENRREATSDSPGRPGRRVRNCQTCFSRFLAPLRTQGAGAEADGGAACAPVRSERGGLGSDNDNFMTTKRTTFTTHRRASTYRFFFRPRLFARLVVFREEVRVPWICISVSPANPFTDARNTRRLPCPILVARNRPSSIQR